mmetsp:Transcript_4707/g.16558  ORF Transcript_4707/g.16558 Transcript_4707/m.16558 type:complete len:248 (-) Transcript_4707:505-1248(-)
MWTAVREIRGQEGANLYIIHPLFCSVALQLPQEKEHYQGACHRPGQCHYRDNWLREKTPNRNLGIHSWSFEGYLGPRLSVTAAQEECRRGDGPCHKVSVHLWCLIAIVHGELRMQYTVAQRSVGIAHEDVLRRLSCRLLEVNHVVEHRLSVSAEAILLCDLILVHKEVNGETLHQGDLCRPTVALQARVNPSRRRKGSVEASVTQRPLQREKGCHQECNCAREAVDGSSGTGPRAHRAACGACSCLA